MPPKEALIVAVAGDVAGVEVVTKKSIDVIPAGTVTETGTTANALSELKLTVVPPAGAGRFKVTMPAAGLPALTLVGETDTNASPAGYNVRFAV